MYDMSVNLPTWTYYLGYRLEGEKGTFGTLYLYKGFKSIRKFDYWKVPNIIEIGEIIGEIESQEIRL